MTPEHECKCSGGQMELIGRPCVGCLLNQRAALLAACVKASRVIGDAVATGENAELLRELAEAIALADPKA